MYFESLNKFDTFSGAKNLEWYDFSITSHITTFGDSTEIHINSCSSQNTIMINCDFFTRTHIIIKKLLQISSSSQVYFFSSKLLENKKKYIYFQLVENNYFSIITEEIKKAPRTQVQAYRQTRQLLHVAPQRRSHTTVVFTLRPDFTASVCSFDGGEDNSEYLL